MNCRHRCISPFPKETPLGTVVDELCRCGHFRSQHVDTVAFGHGMCIACTESNARLACGRFSWMSFVFAQVKKAVSR